MLQTTLAIVLCLVAALAALQLVDGPGHPVVRFARRVPAVLAAGAFVTAVALAAAELGMPWWSSVLASAASLALAVPALVVVATTSSVVVALELVAIVVLATALVAAQLRAEARTSADWRSFERAFWRHVEQDA